MWVLIFCIYVWSRRHLLLQIVLLVYDITNLQSFENLDDWYHTVTKYCASRKPLFALVGNKSKFLLRRSLSIWIYYRIRSGDLEHLRTVKAERHQRFAKERDMLSYFVSAKTGESVENLFRQVTAHLMHIVLPKSDYDATRVITPPIVRQEQNDTSTPAKALPTTNTTRTSICSLQWHRIVQFIWKNVWICLF